MRKIEYNKLWKARNPNYFQKHYAENKDAVNKRQRDFAINNPEIVKEWARRDREKNKANYRKLIKAYKARKRNACPSWVDHEPIKELCRTLPDDIILTTLSHLAEKMCVACTFTGTFAIWKQARTVARKTRCRP